MPFVTAEVSAAGAKSKPIAASVRWGHAGPAVGTEGEVGIQAESFQAHQVVVRRRPARHHLGTRRIANIP